MTEVNIWCMYVCTAQYQTGSDFAIYEFRCKEQSVFIYVLTLMPCLAFLFLGRTEMTKKERSASKHTHK